MNYYAHPAVSNSNLTELYLQYKAETFDREQFIGVFNFGSLCDGMLTTAWRVDRYRYTLLQEDDTILQFTHEVFMLAEQLVTQAKKDPVIMLMVQQMVGQYVFIRTLLFTWEGEQHSIFAKCKFDQYSAKLQTGADYKTLSVKTKKEFYNSVEFFDWDRQAAWYMDLARINRHWIIAISKITGEVFKLAIQRGDEIYTRGVAKYSRLAYLFNLLINSYHYEKSENNLLLREPEISAVL